MNSTRHNQAGSLTLRKQLFNGAVALALAIASLVPLTARAVAPSSGVPYSEILAAAQKVTCLNTSWKIFVVKGDSMEPQFGKNSVILTAPTEFKDLRPGMLVVYQDSFGDMVAHRLIQNTAKGWIAKGYNNHDVDPGLVTSANLQGVIFGVLNYKSGTDSIASAAVSSSPPVALAKRY